jgi:hypothetical protein
MKIHSIVAVMLCAAVAASAQSFYLGPKAAFTVSLSSSEEIAASGTPSKVLFGLESLIQTSGSMAIRIGAAYRIENGGFKTDYQGTSSVDRSFGSRIQVVEPGSGPPQVSSTVETSSIELTAGLNFPVATLDTSGTKIMIGLGVLADYLISGHQSDDYRAVPNYVGETPIAFDYESHPGFGAWAGAGIFFPLGSSGALSLDLAFVFRDPSKVMTVTTPPVEQNIDWLVGRGLRLSAAYLIPF